MPLVADLSTDDGIDAVAEVCSTRPLTVLVNNAGVAHYMPFAELPADKAAELIRVKELAPTMLARAAVPGMLERGEGTIINVAGMIAFSGPAGPEQMPRRAVYTGTLAHLLAWTQQLHAELASGGIKVQVVCPGVVAPEFHSRQGMDLSAIPRMSPEDVVAASLRGLELGEVVSPPRAPDSRSATRFRPPQRRKTEMSHRLSRTVRLGHRVGRLPGRRRARRAPRSRAPRKTTMPMISRYSRPFATTPTMPSTMATITSSRNSAIIGSSPLSGCSPASQAPFATGACLVLHAVVPEHCLLVAGRQFAVGVDGRRIFDLFLVVADLDVAWADGRVVQRNEDEPMPCRQANLDGAKRWQVGTGIDIYGL
jgi:short-subunit dehydrogenase